VEDKFSYLYDTPTKSRNTPEDFGNNGSIRSNNAIDRFFADIRTARTNRNPDAPLSNIVPALKSFVPLPEDVGNLGKTGLAAMKMMALRNDPYETAKMLEPIVGPLMQHGGLDNLLRRYPELTMGLVAPPIAGEAIAEEAPWHIQALANSIRGKEMGIPERLHPILEDTIKQGAQLPITVQPAMERTNFTRPLTDMGETDPHLLMGYSDYPEGYRTNDPHSGYLDRKNELANTLGQFFVKAGKEPNTVDVHDLYKFWTQEDNPEMASTSTSELLKRAYMSLRDQQPMTSVFERAAVKYPNLFKQFPIRQTIPVSPETYDAVKQGINTSNLNDPNHYSWIKPWWDKIPDSEQTTWEEANKPIDFLKKSK
jgi:hypothetical protein